jgi:hypothetical protein
MGIKGLSQNMSFAVSLNGRGFNDFAAASGFRNSTAIGFTNSATARPRRAAGGMPLHPFTPLKKRQV